MSVTLSQQNTGSGKKTARDLSLFFAAAYLVQGLSCAQFGIFGQPLQYFLKDGLRLQAAEVSSAMALMMLPWVVKPVYGVICDFVPLFGYRRKSYLCLVHVLGGLGFCAMLFNSGLPVIISGMMVAAVTMAVATALMVGLAVEHGREDGRTSRYFNIQQICYYAANIVAVTVGGALCQHFAPEGALTSAALVAAVPLLLLGLSAWFAVSEPRTILSRDHTRCTWQALVSAFKSRQILLSLSFSFLWFFTPCFGVPLYFFESNNLGFSQSLIGQLAAVNSLGMLVAALAYRKITGPMSLPAQLYFTAGCVFLSTLSYLALGDPQLAFLLEFGRGMSTMFAIMGLYVVAAGACPAGAEVSVMAVLVAMRNVGTNAATFSGGHLFNNIFANHFVPLVLFACAAPLLSLFLVRLLPKSSKSDSREN